MNSEDNFLRDDVTLSWQRLYQHVKLMLLGHSDTLPRTANLVQVLGNMTVTLILLFTAYAMLYSLAPKFGTFSMSLPVFIVE